MDCLMFPKTATVNGETSFVKYKEEKFRAKALNPLSPNEQKRKGKVLFVKWRV